MMVTSEACETIITGGRACAGPSVKNDCRGRSAEAPPFLATVSRAFDLTTMAYRTECWNPWWSKSDFGVQVSVLCLFWSELTSLVINECSLPHLIGADISRHQWVYFAAFDWSWHLSSSMSVLCRVWLELTSLVINECTLSRLIGADISRHQWVFFASFDWSWYLSSSMSVLCLVWLELTSLVISECTLPCLIGADRIHQSHPLLLQPCCNHLWFTGLKPPTN